MSKKISEEKGNVVEFLTEKRKLFLILVPNSSVLEAKETAIDFMESNGFSIYSFTAYPYDAESLCNGKGISYRVSKNTKKRY